MVAIRSIGRRRFAEPPERIFANWLGTEWGVLLQNNLNPAWAFNPFR